MPSCYQCLCVSVVCVDVCFESLPRTGDERDFDCSSLFRTERYVCPGTTEAGLDQEPASCDKCSLCHRNTGP